MTDTDKRSADIVSSGRVEYLPPSPGQQQRIERVDAAALPRVYAGEGYWYDSFASLAELLAASPDDKQLLKERATLLRQIGLDTVANAAAGGG